MRELTYTQALREALTEEMTRDPNILLLGQDIGLYGGVFKVTEGPPAKFGAERVRDTPISGRRSSARGRAAMTGAPVVEMKFSDFAWDAWTKSSTRRPRSATCPVARQGAAADPHAQGGGRGNGASTRRAWRHFHAHPGPEGRLAGDAVRRQGAAQDRAGGDNPVIFLEHKLLYNTKGPVPEASTHPVRRRRGQAAGEPCRPGQLIPQTAPFTGSCGGSSQGRHFGRGDRPAHDRAA